MNVLWKFSVSSVASLLRASLLLCLLASPLYAGTVSGTVRNGTTNQPAAGVEVILFKLQGGMQVAATTKTDAQGRYSLQDQDLGQAPMLLRAVYRGVNYHQPVTPGKTNVDIQVFEPTDKLDAFSVADRAVILQPSVSSLSVGEIYDIENKTAPPKAYFGRTDRSSSRCPKALRLAKSPRQILRACP
jgi:hypothetical protein